MPAGSPPACYDAGHLWIRSLVPFPDKWRRKITSSFFRKISGGIRCCRIKLPQMYDILIGGKIQEFRSKPSFPQVLCYAGLGLAALLTRPRGSEVSLEWHHMYLPELKLQEGLLERVSPHIFLSRNYEKSFKTWPFLVQELLEKWGKTLHGSHIKSTATFLCTHLCHWQQPLACLVKKPL